jgi:hypothetical protein
MKPLRSCSACQKPDVLLMIEDEPFHTVTIELRFLEAPNKAVAEQKITRYLAAKGWRYKWHLGRHAMERDICRECLLRYLEVEQEFRRKKTNELKGSMNSESFYLALCGD